MDMGLRLDMDAFQAREGRSRNDQLSATNSATRMGNAIDPLA